MPSAFAHPDDLPKRRLAVGLVISILAHVAVLVGLVVVPSSTQADQRLRQRPRADQPTRDDQIRLGNPTSTATSITWIGYDEFEQQYLTEPSKVDQAQFTTSPRPPVPAVIEQPSTAQPPTPIEHAQAPQSVEAHDAPTGPTDDAVDTTLDRALAALEQPPVDTPADLPVSDPLLAQDGTAAKPSDEAAEEPAEAGEDAPADDQSQAADASPASPPSSGTPGDPSDRDSPAAARLVATEAQLGKPLAAHGLKILTVRPRFTHYTTVVAQPRNPLIRISFGPEGSVVEARYLQTSGVKDVDRPLLDAIYQWRATGPQLERLAEGIEGQTLIIEIRIILR